MLFVRMLSANVPWINAGNEGKQKESVKCTENSLAIW